MTELINAVVVKSPEGTFYSVPDDRTWMSTEVEMQEFLYGLVRYLKPALIFESGACRGYGTMALGMACKMNGLMGRQMDAQAGRVVSCEIDPLLIQEARTRVAGLPCVIHEKSSLECPELKEADFIFSDSDYDSRFKEFELAKSGAVFVAHDATLYPLLGAFIKEHGGTVFNRGRGFGLVIKE